MKKSIVKKLIAFVLILGLIGAAIFGFAGCDRQSDRVSYNISQEADNFNVVRRLVVINARTDKPMFELIGAFSFTLDNQRIIAVVQTGPNEFKKHSVGLTDWTLWSVEDISGADVSNYRYEVNFLPEMIVPIEVVHKN